MYEDTLEELLEELKWIVGTPVNDTEGDGIVDEILSRFAEKDRQIEQLEKALEEAKCSTK